MKHIIKFSFVLFSLVLLASCTKDPADCVCTTEYAPVFDKDGKQYDNACLAECAGVEYAESSPETIATIWFNKAERSNCKWFIRIKDKDYRMSNVDKDFYKDGLQVWVSYKEDLSPNDFACNPADVYLDIVRIRIDE